MESRSCFSRTAFAVAAICIVGALSGAAHGEPPAVESPSVKFNPDIFKLPVAPDFGTGGFSVPKPESDKAVALPDRVDLGGSVLRFDTSRDALAAAPKTGIDEADQSVLNPGIRTRKDSPLQPSYFGLTLTTPTH